MSNPAEFSKLPYHFALGFAWPAAWTRGCSPAPERIGQTLYDWLNLQRDYAAAYTRWLDQLRECSSPADFMHAQQAGFALWSQWIGCAMSALMAEATEIAEAAGTEFAGAPEPPAPAPSPAAPPRPKAPRKRAKAAQTSES